ncbi:radical SAM protein, partial [Klebsiella pneumoniae]|uniref:radical SAM protein n=1 Tax=Klebsiella pneumoniae TaxID=573 RepID=UPI0025A0CB04
ARYIRTAHWSITGRCNYRCKHCYMSAPDAKLGELSHETIMSIVQQLIDCGIYQVSLTGGEPLVRKDFMEIVDA